MSYSLRKELKDSWTEDSSCLEFSTFQTWDVANTLWGNKSYKLLIVHYLNHKLTGRGYRDFIVKMRLVDKRADAGTPFKSIKVNEREIYKEMKKIYKIERND